MRMICLAVIAAFAALPVTANEANDLSAVRDLPRQFAAAFAKHDGRALAQIMAEDVDFVTVGATLLRGRSDFEIYHTRLLNGRFKDATLAPLDAQVRFMRPDVALVHWSWRIDGDRNVDGSAREPRLGLMTMVVAKRKGRWSIAAAQNTNATSGSPPEAEGIRSPIDVHPEPK